MQGIAMHLFGVNHLAACKNWMAPPRNIKTRPLPDLGFVGYDRDRELTR